MTDGCQCVHCQVTPHKSDCALHNEPALPIGPCDCGAMTESAMPDSCRCAMPDCGGKWERCKHCASNADDMPELPDPPTHPAWDYSGATGVVSYVDARAYAIAFGRACYRAGMERAAVIADNEADAWYDDEAIGACRNIAIAIRKENEAP